MTETPAADIVESDALVPTLKAMARNYTRGQHTWDDLDALAVLCAATEIEALRAREVELQRTIETLDRHQNQLFADKVSLQRKLDEAVKALEPFADKMTHFNRSDADGYYPDWSPFIAAGRYRHAASALASIRGETGQ